MYGSGALDRDGSLLRMLSPTVPRDRVLHGIVIDDFFLFSLSREVAERVVRRVLAAYQAAGFVVKQSKVVMPTSDPVKVIGFDIDGSKGVISLPSDSQLSLVRSTLAVLRAPTVSGTVLSHVIGRWTWVMMLRRPSLAVLQHVYRYCRMAQHRQFTLWRAVRRELSMLLALLPLLNVSLSAPFFHRAIASDASELAAGVVSSPLTPELAERCWPLCSSRHHAGLQVQHLRHRAAVQAACSLEAGVRTRAFELLGLSDADPAATLFDSFYASVGAADWRTIISAPWSEPEHINVLELRAVLLAVHWMLSYPSSLSARAYLLVDSTVAFFSLWKGRSSSPSLLLVLRKISALLLAGGISLLPGWVPTTVNPADGASRLLPPR